MLYEISRKRITVNKHDETSLSWHDSVLAVRGYKSLHLIDFSYDLHSLDKEIDLKECTINASYDSPVPSNFLSNYAARGVKNLELVEMITNPAFWPHNKMLTQEMTNIVAFKWSPGNLINNYESVLATVNSVGNVELFARKKQLWYSIMDFSKEMMKHLDSTAEMFGTCPKEFKDMEDIVFSVEASRICWAPELNKDNSCYLATAQKSGEILIWSLKYHDKALETKFFGNIKNSNNIEIVLIEWIPLEKNKVLLIITNECGEMIGNEIEIIDNKVTVLHEYSLWKHKDKMMVTYLEYTFKDNKLLLLFNKNRHLVVQMYDRAFNLLSQSTPVVNDHRISSITKHGNVFYLSTFNIKLYRVDYSIVNNSLDVTLINYDIKDSYTTYELHGIECSTNNVLFALAMIDRRLLYRKETLKIEIMFLCSEPDNSVTAIMDNPAMSFTKMWDYIEVMRCRIIKTKKLPELDYNKLLKDGENDMYKLKVYLIFLMFYHSLDKLMAMHIKGRLPETSIDVIKDKILSFQAINVIKNVYEKYTNKIQLTDFDWESFVCSKKYLYYYCGIYSKNPDDFVSEDIFNITNLNVEYTCQACDEKIIQFSCKDNHLNMFCYLTFTLIESDQYLVCKGCGSTARIELYEQKPTCVFCDLHLNV